MLNYGELSKKTKKKTTTFNCFKVGTPIYITDRFLQMIYNLYRIKENRLKIVVYWFCFFLQQKPLFFMIQLYQDTDFELD